MRQLSQFSDGFGAGCFGIVLIGVGVGMMLTGIWMMVA